MADIDMKAMGRAGGIKSGIARNNKREAKDAAKVVLNSKFVPKGDIADYLEEFGPKVDSPVQVRATILSVLAVLAMKGSVAAAKLLFEIADETNESKLSKAKVNALSSIANNAESLTKNNDATPNKETLEEIRRQAKELGVYGD